MLVEIKCIKCRRPDWFEEGQEPRAHVCSDCTEDKLRQEARDAEEEEDQDRAMAEFYEEEARNEARAEDEERERTRAEEDEGD